MSLPLAAIVGRPNVGKSTLFNRLVGKRVSITEPTPGVTRDRLVRPIEWQGNHCYLMDTGGLVAGSDEKMDQAIEEQVDIALDMADILLFVVDGREGLTALDDLAVAKIRKSKKKVILVVNKVNSAKLPMTAYEFFELGFEEMAFISAEQGYGLGDLLDQVFANLPQQSKSSGDDEAIKVCLLGKPNVGKSSLVNWVLGENRVIVTDIPGTTRDSIDTYFDRDGKSYVLIDTAGLRKKSSVNSRVEKYSNLRTLAAVDRSDICLFMIDASQGVSEQDTKIAGYAHNQGKAAIILVNKWDLVEKKTNSQRDYEIAIRQALSFNLYVPILFISVLEERGLDQVFQVVNQVDENYQRRIPTGLLVQLIRDSMAMTPPPTDKGERLKIYYASQVRRKPPKILFHCNDKKLFHFSYLRYLENQIRKNFDFTGVPLELKIRQRREKKT